MTMQFDVEAISNTFMYNRKVVYDTILVDKLD